MTLSPKLGVVGISTLWHFRLPLPIQMFIKVASSPRLSGIGMPSPILWSHPLKMQRIVLLSSLLWWELGTNSLITGPGEWFGVSPVNYPDPDPEATLCLELEVLELMKQSRPSVTALIASAAAVVLSIAPLVLFAPRQWLEIRIRISSLGG